MAHLIGLFRLGRDAEVRYMPDGTAVANLSLAYNYGRKDDSGKRPSQWIDAALFGKRAESLTQYLTKGTAIDAILSEPHIETYSKKDGTTGVKLSAVVVDIEFAGGRGEQSASAGEAAPAPRQERPAPAARSAPFDDMSDDIPF